MLSLQNHASPQPHLVQGTSSQFNRNCTTSRRATQHRLGLLYLLTTSLPLGFDYYLHLSLPLLHSNHQPHSSQHSQLTTHPPLTSQQITTNKQINQQQHTANMQLTNYALTLLLPAYLAAAQGGAESVGNDIGQGLGAVSFPRRPTDTPQTQLTISNRQPALLEGPPQLSRRP
jgi:hypothetical protein